jgi:hypothetical protein
LFALITKLFFAKKLQRLKDEHKEEEEMDRMVIDE